MATTRKYSESIRYTCDFKFSNAISIEESVRPIKGIFWHFARFEVRQRFGEDLTFVKTHSQERQISGETQTAGVRYPTTHVGGDCVYGDHPARRVRQIWRESTDKRATRHGQAFYTGPPPPAMWNSLSSLATAAAGLAASNSSKRGSAPVRTACSA